MTDRPAGKTIQEMAAQYGLTYRALRFYEKLGLLKPARQSRQRYYSQEQESILRLILHVNALGVPFPEIGRRMDWDNGTITLTRKEIYQTCDAIEAEIAAAKRQRYLCNRVLDMSGDEIVIRAGDV